MPFYFAIYGYEITKRIELSNFTLFPVTEKFQEAKNLAQDRNEFHLTAVGEIKNEPNPEDLFDLAGALTFCQQQWVVVSNSYEFPENNEFTHAIEKFSPIYKTTNKRPTQGAIIIEDAFDPEARKNYLELCISRLRDKAFENNTNFRKAFFRNVEIWRMQVQYIDVTYYYDFSSLEILARTFTQNYESPVAAIATNFLNNHGFAIKQDNVHARHLGIQTYVHLRNSLFHNGNFEKSFQENGSTVTLKLNDYASYLSRLMPDVLLRVIGYDDGHINWNRWIDCQSFKG
ncbi:MAG: hypothetical protein A2521_05155 [Deltaproteobacteria bacterium RIFOXYD12_FULL_57_12]|nr:MAG: hypothetical protein A2521_05155 [Deltaproteobacteria bacterium RIFOXYD12_FULL_57_12]